MDYNEEPRPTKENIHSARDAVTLARLVVTGQRSEAAHMIESLLSDPPSIPGVLYGLCGLIRHALPQDVDPEVLFQTAYKSRDAVTLARFVLADDLEASTDMIQSILFMDARSVVGVMDGLCGLLAHALPRDQDPGPFFQSAYAMLDSVADDC